MQNAHGGLLLRNNEAIIGARTASRERELSARQFPRFSTFVKFAHFSDFQMSIFSKITDLQICNVYYAAIYKRASFSHDPIISRVGRWDPKPRQAWCEALTRI